MAQYLKFIVALMLASLLGLGTAVAAGRKAQPAAAQERESDDPPNELRSSPDEPKPLPKKKVVEDLPQPESSSGDPLVEYGLIPPEPTRPPRHASPPEIDHSYDLQTEGAYDVVGSFMDPDTLGPRRRPLYPYNATEYFPGQDADVEEWGDLLELPYVRLGWFTDAESTMFKPQISAHFNSGTLLDGVFPGNPVMLPASNLDWNLMPKIELGYRFEHGLGEIRGAYHYISANGQDPLAGFDSGGLGLLRTKMQLHCFDLDWSSLEFNSQGLSKGIPWISSIFKIPGRRGLGKPLTADRFVLPVEGRIYMGLRAATMFYESTGEGDLLRERVTSNFYGAGLHFGFQMNQQLSCNLPLFWHFRGDCSGVFGNVSQTFERNNKVLGAAAFGGFRNDSMGLPTANVEFGLSWVPNWPERQTRLTLAYQFEEWFSFAEAQGSTANLLLQGVLLRCERKF